MEDFLHTPFGMFLDMIACRQIIDGAEEKEISSAKALKPNDPAIYNLK